MDASHDFGSDLQAAANGDLLSVDGTDETRQRVLRRLYTPVGAYLWDLAYGAGVPLRVGQTLPPDRLAGINADILAACAQETGVAQFPAPSVTLTPGDNSLSGNVTFYDAATKTPQVVYFPAGS